MIAANILVVDDEPDICSLVKEILEDEGFNVTVAKNAAEARAARGGINFDLILLDIWMPDTDGISLLKEWSESGLGSLPVIMMSGHGTVETAVEATRLGAYDFLEKPLSLAKLVLTVKHALETADLQQENLRLRQYGPHTAEIIGRSEAMRQLREQIKRVASHNAPVLIIGEAGTDKEAVARVLHNQSAYCDGPFVPVTMTALSQDGPAIELFGKESGGQIAPGYIEKATGGTLFLKDITGMGMATQSKLQAALEGRSFTRIGGVEPVTLDARVVAATPAPLDERVREGSFRNDLYFQLNIVPILVPPIREHYEDIPEILDYYVNFFVESEGLPYKRFSTAAQNRLRMYSWPGNVREIKNLVQRLLIIGASDTIDLPDVEKSLGEQPGKEKVESLYNFDMPLRDARDRFEKAYLEHQLKLYNGSVSKIAKVAGMERTHLYRKLKSLNIELKS
ncbi:MAG: sigma-54-dependent Fis family transcriptional regulator [Gammaproteobacteria bacterium]|jgi:DNA-binding NtrC family response regulator|nr:MAG: sigma-54-dependent Fis family transcriptional regulator [Gammaproteobacteria bacterium]